MGPDETPRCDWRFDLVCVSFLAAMLLLGYLVARYVPGAPLNLLARIAALEARADRAEGVRR